MSVSPFCRGNRCGPVTRWWCPRAEVDHWIDLDEETLATLMRVARSIARAQQAAYRPTKVGLLIAGLEVPHVHIHVSPIDGMHDMDFANVSPFPGDEALAPRPRASAPRWRDRTRYRAWLESGASSSGSACSGWRRS